MRLVVLFIAVYACTMPAWAQRQQGFFPFTQEEDKGRILLEVSHLDEDFLYFGAIASGAGSAAEKGRGTSFLLKFTQIGDKVFLIKPESHYRAVTDNADIVKGVETAFAKSVVWSFPILSQGAAGPIVDLTPFLMRDFQGVAAGLARAAKSPSGGTVSYRADESRSALIKERTKNFPLNSEFEAMVTFVGGPADGGYRMFGAGASSVAPDPTSVTVHLHHSFVALPEAGFTMREFDPRSGFNAFSYYDFAAPMTSPLEKRFIRRHRLIKKDPKKGVSEPVKPIRYYVDRAAPEPIKSALIEGGSWWNEAFEAAGFKNAFIIEEMPEGADPMDIRYNVINWVNRPGDPRGYSYGSSYCDPRTGEIIKGVVTLGSDRHRQDYLIAEGLLQPYAAGKGIPKEMEEMALARIRQLSAHEIGHTLGLTHNFTSSVKERGSVMDYPFPRINLKADGSIDLSDAYAVGIGSWDIRTIKWGYSTFDEAKEKQGLAEIMKETLDLGHQYIPDIGGYVHPVSHQWDDGKEAIDQLFFLMKVREKVLNNFSVRAIQDGQPTATVQEVLVPMYLLHRYQIEGVAKSVGGLYFTHAVKDDGQEPTRLVEPERQWKALAALLQTIRPEALALPEKLIALIPPRPSGYGSTRELFSSHTGVTFDPLSAAASVAEETISSLLNSEKAARLIEHHSRDAAQPSFFAVLDTMLTNTWYQKLPSGMHGSLQTVVNNVLLDQLLGMAADDASTPLVRGQVVLKIGQLKKALAAKTALDNDAESAMNAFALQRIKDFEANPAAFKPIPSVEMPPGAPIMPNMDFLKHRCTNEHCFELMSLE